MKNLNQRQSDNPWLNEEHASIFGAWGSLSKHQAIKRLGQYNDCKLFMKLVRDNTCHSISDIGCASGGFYRFFSKHASHLEYKGFDISQLALEKAKEDYPNGDFRLFDGDLTSEPQLKADIIFCRDVILHQYSPVAFMSDLYNLTGVHLLIRLRTRDHGTTEYDSDISCQYAYEQWVPYIVFNTSELIELLRSFIPQPSAITLLKHPSILGGTGNRYLPKDLYEESSGTAHTSILITKGSHDNKLTKLEVGSSSEQLDSYRSKWLNYLITLGNKLGL